MSNEIMPPEPDLELFQALEELKKKREPWYMDRWMIASVSAIGGALFMYVARQPEVDHYKNFPPSPHSLTRVDRAAQAVKEPMPATSPLDSPLPAQGPQLPKGTSLGAATGSATDGRGAEGTAVATTGAARAEMLPDASRGRPAPRSDISGSMGGSSMRPMSPGEIGTIDGALPSVTGAASNLPAPSPSIEPIPGLTISGAGSSSSGTVLANIAKALGGGLKKYQEYTGRDKYTSGYIVWVPEKNSRAFLDKLKSARGVDISDQQEGSGESRSRLLTERLHTILARLTKARADLLVKYYEDAPSVKEVDGQIAEVNKSISSLRTPGAGYAVAKIETE